MEILVHRSRRAKRLSLKVHPVRGIWVSASLRTSQKNIDVFVSKHRGWAVSALQRLRTEKILVVAPYASNRSWRARATKELRGRAQYFAGILGVDFVRFTLKNTSTRWGSCSSLGHIAIHEKTYFLPPELSDYILVHELCHRKHMNHSAVFWLAVGQVIPDYRVLRARLRRYCP